MKNMNNISNTVVKTIAIILTMAGCVYAGNEERIDEVLYSMSESQYLFIQSKLGSQAKSRDIANEYIDNRAYYDSVNKDLDYKCFKNE